VGNRSAFLARWGRQLSDSLATLHKSRPIIEPSSELADCGYTCISAVMALLGQPLLVEEIKTRGGTTSRGLTLRQVRDILRGCGALAEVIYFDRTRTESFPPCGIVLLSRGHYVVTVRQRRDRIEIFDPQMGWTWVSRRWLARRCNGLAVMVDGLQAPISERRERPSTAEIAELFRPILKRRSGAIAVGIFAGAQLITLLLPLLSMWSVDRSLAGVSVGILGAIAIGFGALSVTNIFVSLAGNLAQSKAKRLASIALSCTAFDSLAAKPPYWFENSNAGTIQNRVGSLSALLDFYVEAVRTAGTTAVTLAIGVFALFFISPLLLLPGLVALLISVGLDLMFERVQRSHFASVLETSQRRQWFVMDTISQLPAIVRFGALPSAKSRFTLLNRHAERSQAYLSSLKAWQSALRGLAKSGETLFFVTIAAAFMGAGDFTIGGFVALGAYKDLLASAISSIFALHLQRRGLEVHKLQGSALLRSRQERQLSFRVVERGEISFERVCFSYGSLDKLILDKVSFSVKPGECVIVRGPSGTGKSTIAKLLVGHVQPTAGSVLIDGNSPADTTLGMASVLQSDRLITGSIRENIVFFRRGVSDADVLEALELAAIKEFVLSLPMRLSTQIGESMAGLSGGQRQRLLIARAVLARPKLLVLDEATSSLEVKVEAEILGALRRSGTTLLLFAHRPEVWALADRIYTLDGEGGLEEERREGPSDVGFLRAAAT